MGLISPWFLAGLSALALPVYVHLLRQHKTTPQPFSSLMFFEARTQSSVKHRRLKYLALFAMRMALIALLALTFAGFYVGCAANKMSSSRLTIIAVDRSMSMKAGTRMSDAKAQAAGVITAAPAAVQLLAFDSKTDIVTQPATDKAGAQSALTAMIAGDGRAAYGNVSRMIASLAHTSNVPVEAHIFTDMQKSSLPTPFSELALPSNVTLKLHSVASKSLPNYYVERVQAPRHVFGAGKVRVQTTIAGSGVSGSDLSASLVLNNKTIESKKVNLTGDGRSAVDFDLGDLPYGFNRGEVRIETPDALPQDNRFPFSIERKEASRILLTGNERSSLYYRAALESVPAAGFTVDVLSSDQAAHAALEKYALVVLSDPSTVPQSVVNYVARGGGLLVALGPSSIPLGRVPVTNQRILESRYASRQGERFQSASAVDASHPLLASTDKLDGIKFYQTIRFDPGDARVLARLADGSPLLTESKVGDGKVIVFASTLDNVSNDFPLHASFVPFAESGAVYLSGFDRGTADHTVGSFVELRTAREAGTGVEVIGPEGKRELSLGEAARMPSFQLAKEGFYEIHRANGRNDLIASHSDRRESDLALIPNETLNLWQNSGTASRTTNGPAAPPGEERKDLWRYFAIALLLISLGESLFSSRFVTAESQPVAVRKQAA